MTHAELEQAASKGFECQHKLLLKEQEVFMCMLKSLTYA